MARCHEASGAEVVTMQCSFAADRDGREYDLARAGAAPDPASLRPRNAPGPWESAFLGPTPEREDGTFVLPDCPGEMEVPGFAQEPRGETVPFVAAALGVPEPPLDRPAAEPETRPEAW